MLNNPAYEQRREMVAKEKGCAPLSKMSRKQGPEVQHVCRKVSETSKRREVCKGEGIPADMRL
jgi:hypothetical protein